MEGRKIDLGGGASAVVTDLFESYCTRCRTRYLFAEVPNGSSAKVYSKVERDYEASSKLCPECDRHEHP